MLILAIWLPPVGVFGGVLAFVGALVSILGFKGLRRVVLASVFIILGVGEVAAIFKGDADHKAEVNRLNNSITQVQDTLVATQLKSAADLSYLKAKLEDSEKLNEKLSQFAPAIMKLAQVSAEFTRKQYEAKVISDKELHDLTMDVVKRIRAFSQKYETLSRQQSEELVNNTRQPNLTEAQRDQIWNQAIQKSVQLNYAKDAEFRRALLPDALDARQELLKRKFTEPTMTPMQKSEVDMVTKGILAGPYPEMALADYLEIMAKQLSK